MKLRGGYNVLVAGRPSSHVTVLPVPSELHLSLASRRFAFTDVRVEDGARVRAGEILATDPGASYMGEFSFGLHPCLHRAIKDTLFDEKIYGSFHTALGQCYENAANGNESAIHWDLVCIQTEEYGGGSVWFDGKLVREHGHWTHPELRDVLSIEALTADEEREPEPVG